MNLASYYKELDLIKQLSNKEFKVLKMVEDRFMGLDPIKIFPFDLAIIINSFGLLNIGTNKTWDNFE